MSIHNRYKGIAAYLIAGMLVFMGLTSCDVSTDPRFDSEGTERINEAVRKYDLALRSGGRWVLEYFPDDNQRYGGWVYVLEFQEKNMLKAWFEGSTFITESEPVTESEYKVEFTSGPMLKFCTHNDYLHYFSFPGDHGTGYQGLKGDYEFTVMSVSANMDEFVLRGIKTGNMLKMSHLPERYTPEQYIDEVRSAQLLLLDCVEMELTANGTKIGTLTRSSGPKMSGFSSYSESKVWTINYSYQSQLLSETGTPVVGEDGEPVYETVEVSDKLSAITLADGTMKLYAPYEFKGDAVSMLKGQTMQTFRWTLGALSAMDSYVCEDSFFDFRLVPIYK